MKRWKARPMEALDAIARRSSSAHDNPRHAKCLGPSITLTAGYAIAMSAEAGRVEAPCPMPNPEVVEDGRFSP